MLIRSDSQNLLNSTLTRIWSFNTNTEMSVQEKISDISTVFSEQREPEASSSGLKIILPVCEARQTLTNDCWLR